MAKGRKRGRRLSLMTTVALVKRVTREREAEKGAFWELVVEDSGRRVGDSGVNRGEDASARVQQIGTRRLARVEQ